MSKIEVNAIEPQCGTNLTVGASGDTIIIPSGATISNQGTAAGFGPTGAVSWNTTKITADPNPAVTGVGYFADTTSAAFTITLPSSPSAGAVVGIADYANTFATNSITVDRNGSNIGGAADNTVLSINGIAVTLVYVDATQGWIVTDSGSRSDLPGPQYIAATGGTITCCGDYKIHTFTGPGTFTVTSVGNPVGSTTVDYLVVAGGGGGGNSSNVGGGGGAGGVRFSATTYCSASPLKAPAALPVSATSYPITIGGGGTGSIVNNPGCSGSNSVFSTITSAGGGAGGGGPELSGTPARSGLPGGSGGGGAYGPGPTSPATNGGTGNTPPVAPPQGNNGAGGGPQTQAHSGGGGGGFTAAGTTSAPNISGGVGGNGLAISITGSPVARGGGGGGGSQCASYPGGAGGLGGGGAGGQPSSGTGVAGTGNTGGGGGGSGPSNGGSGGSGIVIIRYKFQ
jgi:hypothetical protein